MNEYLSPIEAIMWRVGQDPTLRMTVGAVMILDHAPSTSALSDRLSSAADHTPRLRQRPGDPTFTSARPAWIEGPKLDLHHLRSAAIASPGSLRQLLDLVALFEAMPFDPERPPWDVTLIEGVEGGRAALYFRAHHVVTDGLSALRLAGALFDEEGWPRHRDDEAGRERTQPRRTPRSARRSGTVTIDFTKVTGTLRHRVSHAFEVEALDTVVRGLQRGLEVANSVSRQVMVTGGPLSPLFVDHSMASRFEVFSVPHAREAALELGGSRNDLLVAAAAAGLGLYHDGMGRPSPKLRLATPASQRRGREIGGNWFAPARVEVPTGAGHPGRQFGVIAERLAQARREPALQLTNALAWTIGRLPTRLLLPALQAQADSVDFAATALPGLHRPRHVCGALVEATYPFGPRLGCPVSFTAFGNGDRLDIGIALDPAAIPEPQPFLDSMTKAIESFVPATHVSSANAPLEQLLG
ncbi:MAG: wax ester/triacylglycerol synthase domain-containing protein [Acidimicrobiia bacterium]